MLSQHWGHNKEAAESGLPPQAESAVSRADLAVECAHAAALCVLRCASCQGGLSAHAARAVGLLRKPLAAFAHCFALTPLPFPANHRRARFPSVHVLICASTCCRHGLAMPLATCVQDVRSGMKAVEVHGCFCVCA